MVQSNTVDDHGGTVSIGRHAEEVSTVVGQLAELDRIIAHHYDDLYDFGETARTLDQSNALIASALDGVRAVTTQANVRLANATVRLDAMARDAPAKGTTIRGLLELGFDQQTHHGSSLTDAMIRLHSLSATAKTLAGTLDTTAEQARDKQSLGVAAALHILSGDLMTIAGDLAVERDRVGIGHARWARNAAGVADDVEDFINGLNEPLAALREVDELLSAGIEGGRMVAEIFNEANTVSSNLFQLIAGAARALGQARVLLRQTQARTTRLEQVGRVAFERAAALGLNEEDKGYVTLALDLRDELQALTQAALEQGSLSLEQLFDNDYQPILGSLPERFRTSLTEWADAKWRPFLDAALTRAPQIRSAVCSDMSGFLPTHLSSRSQRPTGDPAHDIGNCRNGRIMYDDRLRQYKENAADFTATIYRMDDYSGGFIIVRLILVPLSFAGKRWGDFELAYSI
jgi:methyl-accepting chemotaxis protein